MRTRLQNAPRWVMSVVLGSFFAVFTGCFTGIYARNDGTSVAGSLLIGVFAGLLGGVFFGVLMGSKVTAMTRQARDAAGSLEADQFAVVAKASTSGPIPTDRALRRAAADLARHRLAQTKLSGRLPNAVFFGLATIAYTAAAIWTSHWLAILGAILFGFFFIGTFWTAARLRRRIALLEAEPMPVSEV